MQPHPLARGNKRKIKRNLIELNDKKETEIIAKNIRRDLNRGLIVATLNNASGAGTGSDTDTRSFRSKFPDRVRLH